MKKSVSIQLSGFLAFLLAGAPQAARANAIETSPTLPPTVGGYSLSTACASLGCLVNGFVSNFSMVTTFGSDESADGTALFTGDLYQNNHGNPGMFVGHLSVTATVGLDYANRTTPTETGDFFTTLTEFDFSANVANHTFMGRLASEDPLNPGPASTGDTDLSQISGQDRWIVSGDLTIYAELKVDNSPFTAGPMRFADIEATAVPEPSAAWLLLTGVAGVFVAARLRRSRN